MLRKSKSVLSYMLLATFLLSSKTLCQTIKTPNDPYTEAVENLLKITRFDESTLKIFDESFKLPDEVVKQMGSEDKTKFTNMKKIISRELPKILKEFHPEVITIYKQSLSKADIDAIIAFYNTPVGKKSIETLPKIATQIHEKVTQIINKKLVPLLEKELGGDLKP